MSAEQEVLPVPVSASPIAKDLPPPFDLEKHIQVRAMKDELGNETEFRFLVIDSEEKWQDATHFAVDYDMPHLGGGPATRFRLNGLSLLQWDEVETAHIMPTWSGEGEPNEDFEREKERVAREKMAHVLEISIGKTIPGETWQAKATWMENRNPGEFQAIYLAAQWEACSIRDGMLLNAYNLAAELAVIQPKVFSGFDNWAEASHAQYTFRMHRPGTDYIAEFPLKGISSRQREEIERECKDPEPPKVPSRDPVTRKLDYQKTVPNLQDAAWLQKSRQVARKRSMMFFNACLPFQIPGKTIVEQFDWLGSRLVGDVVRLKNFIIDDLTSHQSRYRFL